MIANAHKRQNARPVWPGRKSRFLSDRLGFQRVPKGTCGGFHAGISLACMQATCAPSSSSRRRESSGCTRRKPVGTSQGFARQAGWVSVVHHFGLAQVLRYIAINLIGQYTTRRIRRYHRSRPSLSHPAVTGLENNLSISTCIEALQTGGLAVRKRPGGAPAVHAGKQDKAAKSIAWRSDGDIMAQRSHCSLLDHHHTS